jgi:5-methylcytosine-specific restriction endonuclease McrA
MRGPLFSQAFNPARLHIQHRKQAMPLSKDRQHHSAAWRRFRAAIIERDNDTCQMCKAKVAGKGKRAAEVDHLIPESLRPDLFLDPHNCWTLCRHCHSTVAQAIERRHEGDPVAIVTAKKAHRPVGLDGYRR